MLVLDDRFVAQLDGPSALGQPPAQVDIAARADLCKAVELLERRTPDQQVGGHRERARLPEKGPLVEQRS